MALAIKYKVADLIEATILAREAAHKLHFQTWQSVRRDRLAEIRLSLKSLEAEQDKLASPDFKGDLGKTYGKTAFAFDEGPWNRSIARLRMISEGTVTLNEKDNHFLTLAGT